jgi:hypothetical protein
LGAGGSYGSKGKQKAVEEVEAKEGEAEACYVVSSISAAASCAGIEREREREGGSRMSELMYDVATSWDITFPFT